MLGPCESCKAWADLSATNAPLGFCTATVTQPAGGGQFLCFLGFVCAFFTSCAFAFVPRRLGARAVIVCFCAFAFLRLEPLSSFLVSCCPALLLRPFSVGSASLLFQLVCFAALFSRSHSLLLRFLLPRFSTSELFRCSGFFLFHLAASALARLCPFRCPVLHGLSASLLDSGLIRSHPAALFCSYFSSGLLLPLFYFV